MWRQLGVLEAPTSQHGNMVACMVILVITIRYDLRLASHLDGVLASWSASLYAHRTYVPPSICWVYSQTLKQKKGTPEDLLCQTYQLMPYFLWASVIFSEWDHLTRWHQIFRKTSCSLRWRQSFQTLTPLLAIYLTWIHLWLSSHCLLWWLLQWVQEALLVKAHQQWWICLVMDSTRLYVNCFLVFLHI